MAALLCCLLLSPTRAQVWDVDRLIRARNPGASFTTTERASTTWQTLRSITYNPELSAGAVGSATVEEASLVRRSAKTSLVFLIPLGSGAGKTLRWRERSKQPPGAGPGPAWFACRVSGSPHPAGPPPVSALSSCLTCSAFQAAGAEGRGGERGGQGAGLAASPYSLLSAAPAHTLTPHNIKPKLTLHCEN